MKTRSGFVSNSSSSSFIIQWQCNVIKDLDNEFLFEDPEEMKDDPDLNKAISILLDFCNKDTIKEIIESTEEMSGEGRYITRFNTCMRNSVEDFGTAALTFFTALEIENIEKGVARFEKIHTQIVDGEW